jgi:hypothetical protein
LGVSLCLREQEVQPSTVLQARDNTAECIFERAIKLLSQEMAEGIWLFFEDT